ncbi:MAG: hypothetical protein KAT68_02025 [Bacteroidales bacterium]|nr:hypothetical protein [Bacteroidales bacterium]
MKIKLTITVLICLLIMSCEKDNNDNKIEIGNGFEIYLTVTPYSHNLYKDYSIIDFDTILLSDTPILRYNDLEKYDTITHKLTLGISHDSLKIGDAEVYGRMFVVTIDMNPIYCGFKWPVISSIPCNWVFIEEPYEDLDNLNDNEIVISFVSEEYADPRLDKRIVDRWKTDGKIK